MPDLEKEIMKLKDKLKKENDKLRKALKLKYRSIGFHRQRFSQ